MARHVHHYNWTPEMDVALKELYGLCPATKIAEEINTEFGTGFSLNAIYNRARALQLTGKKTSYHNYTKEQDEWLRQNITKYTYPDLAGAFNQIFNTNIGYYALKNHCFKKRFKGGNPYHKGYRNWRSAPIGTERIGNDGRIWVKVSDLPTKRTDKNHLANWMPKGRLVWEQHHGKIPEGHNIVFLDGDPLNCDISNLECTTNSIQGQISLPFKGTSPELKRCAIKMKTLEKILTEVERNENC